MRKKEVHMVKNMVKKKRASIPLFISIAIIIGPPNFLSTQNAKHSCFLLCFQDITSKAP